MSYPPCYAETKKIMKTDISPKRRSKIVHLPKNIQEELNGMLDEGATYHTIIDWLASKGHPDFNENHLFHWRKGGYQDWRQEQERKGEANALRQWASAIADEKDQTVLANALSNFTGAKLHRLLCTLDFDALGRALQDRPEVCIRYFNSILRTGRISLEAARVRHSCRTGKEKRAPTRKEVSDLVGLPHLADDFPAGDPPAQNAEFSDTLIP